MSFQPFVVGSGLSAWTLLKSTIGTQKAAFGSNYVTQSDTKYFSDVFDTLDTPEDIVSNRRALRVVLGAYGLSDDIENRHFIKTVMAEGVTDPSALANKLSDRRYRALAGDFDFSKSPPSHKSIADLASRTVDNYLAQSFEIEIGKTDPDMRLALGFKRSLAELAQSATSNKAAWFQILATPPIKEVVQTALGLPTEFSKLDIDDQHQRIMEKASQVFGTDNVSELSAEDVVEQMTRRFLIMRQAKSGGQSTSLQTALVLLSSIPKRE